MKELKKGDMVCLITSPYTTTPSIGFVLHDWDYWKHGDFVRVKWLDPSIGVTTPHLIQKIENFGKETF